MSEHVKNPTPPTPPPAVLSHAERIMTLFVPLYILLFAAGCALAIAHIESWIQWAALTATLPIAWALADFITGVTHWVLDTYGSEDTPIVGYVLIKPFRMHHDFPTFMVQYDDAPTIANSAAGTVPIHLGLMAMTTLGGWWALLGLTLMIAFAGAVGTNLFHKWAHMEEPPAIGKLLQRMGLILGVEHHEIHHVSPHDCSYCITNGWLNPLLDRVNFWRSMERLLAIFGARPQSEIYKATEGEIDPSASHHA